MVAADQITKGGDQRVATNPNAAGRKNLAVESHIGAIGNLDVSVLARKNRIAADEHARTDPNADVRFPFGIEQTVIVDDDVVADLDLVWMTENDVLSEDHVAPARSEK